MRILLNENIDGLPSNRKCCLILIDHLDFRGSRCVSEDLGGQHGGLIQ